MDYESINRAILNSRDVPKSIPRHKKFYDYLLDNNVAFYYCSHLSKQKNATDERIITAGNILNDKFLKTLKLISRVSKENRIKFLLFKTYKYIPEVVDGDIDIIISERDFHKFLKALEKIGFYCIENEPLKAFCKKEGYSNIEPRVNAEFHEIVILDEKRVWENVEQVKIQEIEVSKVTKEIDLLYLLSSILYGPNYLKLYLLMVYKKNDISKLFTLTTNNIIERDLKFLLRNLITDNIENKRFPLFFGDINFAIWWFRRILPNSNLSLFVRLKQILFFFYSKYSYLFFNKLVFKHNWPL